MKEPIRCLLSKRARSRLKNAQEGLVFPLSEPAPTRRRVVCDKEPELSRARICAKQGGTADVHSVPAKTWGGVFYFADISERKIDL